jgi:hypothetical protein
MTTDQMFDAVLDGVRNHTLKGSYTGCMCPRHNPWPRSDVPRYWRSRFGNADWNYWTALHALGLDEIVTPRDDEPGHTDDGVEGFANERGVWLRKDTPLPFKTAAHELAHHVLGHVAGTKGLEKEVERVESQHDVFGLIGILSYKISKEIEAEMTSLLVVAALGYPDGRDHTLSSVLSYFKGQAGPLGAEFPDRNTVKAAARKILQAGGWQEQAQAA